MTEEKITFSDHTPSEIDRPVSIDHFKKLNIPQYPVGYLADIIADLKQWNDDLKELEINSKVPFNTKDISPKMITPAKMWTTKGGYTTVEWMDGTKTTVKAENEETATEFGGFTAALAKKIFRTTANVNREIEKAKEKAEEPARKRKELRERNKRLKQAKHERMLVLREERIREMMEEQRMRNIAMERLDKEGSKT